MRLPAFGKPRVISSAEFFPKHIALPRGSLDAILTLLSELGVKSNLQDERNMGTELNASFLGELSDQQKTATEALLRHDIGMLAKMAATRRTGYRNLSYMEIADTAAFCLERSSG